jgi:hypothetical protein
MPLPRIDSLSRLKEEDKGTSKTYLTGPKSFTIQTKKKKATIKKTQQKML